MKRTSFSNEIKHVNSIFTETWLHHWAVSNTEGT